MKENSPIVWVSHELDGDWQFTGKEELLDFTKQGMVVSLENIIKLDKSVLKVADLPMGYCATRQSKRDKWTVHKIDYTEQEMKEFGFYCSKCGVYHKEIPMAYGANAPEQCALLPDSEIEKRIVLTQDQCIIDENQFFIKGRLEINVEDNLNNFCWNVWVEVSKQDFERIADLWNNENRILEVPYLGIIATHLELYPETIGLQVKVVTQPVGYSPIIELEESNHPLFLEQESGINMERVTAFAKHVLYNH